MSIESNLLAIRQTLSPGVTLVAVSKTHPTSSILQAYGVGQRDFGENRVQELLPKIEACPPDIRWHLIGHLQRNKVRSVVGRVVLIHSVDSLRLLEAIDREAQALGLVQDVLLQVHVALEETKFGLPPDGLRDLVRDLAVHPRPGVRILGLMGMATHSDDPELVHREFAQLREIYDWMCHVETFPAGQIHLLSMGMSGDYQLAIEAGSNMVRLGSTIFGRRA